MNIFDSWLVQKRIAHRGLFEEGKPENSLAAFENAIANNYAIELDVRALKDGTIVVFHDDKLGRMRTETLDINTFMHEIAEYMQTNYKYHLKYGTCIFSKENLQSAVEAKRKSNYTMYFFKSFNLRRDQYDR